MFHTVADTLAADISKTLAADTLAADTSRTLPVDTSRTLLATQGDGGSVDDLTLADSVVDNMVSCCDTLVGDNDTCATPTDFYSDDDNPYPTVDFNSLMTGPTGRIVEPGDSPGVVHEGE